MRSVPYQRYWLRLLGLGDYSVKYVKVNHRGVLDEMHGRLNNSFVGAAIDQSKGSSIYFIPGNLRSLMFSMSTSATCIGKYLMKR